MVKAETRLAIWQNQQDEEKDSHSHEALPLPAALVPGLGEETQETSSTGAWFEVHTIPQKAEQHCRFSGHSSCCVQNVVQASGSDLQGGGSRTYSGMEW